MPVRFNLPLNKIAPVEYNFQVSVPDVTAQKGRIWQAPVMLVP